MPTIHSTLQDIRGFRLEKVYKLRELGIDPYPSKSHRTNLSAEIISKFDDFENQTVTIAGRLMSWREHGQLVFGNLQDQSGQIQLYIKADQITPTDATAQTLGFEHLTLLDIGDLVEAEGIVTKTQRGEMSILVRKLRLLAKSIRPLPEKWTGVKNKETLFRQRYLDMIMNPEKKWKFEKYAQVLFAIRNFLNEKGFLEIKTPILQPLYGGGTAKPFQTHMHSLDTDFYLSISHELYLKRLITAGFEKVFNIAGYFRNEGIDRTHNPEFQMLETMTAFENYEYNMDLIEELYKYIAKTVFNKEVFMISGQEVDFSKPWERITMLNAVKKYTTIDFNILKTLKEAQDSLKKLGYKDELPNTIGECMVAVFEHSVENKLIQPTFLTNHPIEISPLAKTLNSDPRFVERFEIYIGGIEGGDNWSELNDPVELYERFKEQFKKGRAGKDEFHPMDINFIETIEYGMPPTTGLGPGIERLVMMFTESDFIDDVLFFPVLRPTPYTQVQKQIYGEEYLIDTETVKQENTKLEPEPETKKNIIHEKIITNQTMTLPTREEAEKMLGEHVKDDYQVLHANMVAKAMESYAIKFDDDPGLWFITGLLHDLDYFEFPSEHPKKELEWFAQWGYPQELIHAVEAHARGYNGFTTEPETKMAAALMACDEISGLIHAYSLMRPTGYEGMEVKSVMKKYKDKAFAAKINRDDIAYGVEKLGITLEEHIANLLKIFPV